MLAINTQGILITPDSNGNELPVTGVIFLENIYSKKCRHFAETSKMPNRDNLIDQTMKMAIK